MNKYRFNGSSTGYRFNDSTGEVFELGRDENGREYYFYIGSYYAYGIDASMSIRQKSKIIWEDQCQR